MDLISECKEKLTRFRVKELKDVLTQLCLSKQGKKQDLIDRILAGLSDDQDLKTHAWAVKNSIGREDVVKIIEDTYRKMQTSGATDLASTAPSSSDVNNMKFKEEIDNSFQLEKKVRCPCGSLLLNESLIQCEDPRCHVWQHINCVIIPEKPTDCAPPVPPQFYCEICRINRSDPFWVTLAHPLLPVKLAASNLPIDGGNPVQNVDTTFRLTKADRDLLQKADFEVQAWCILFNDKVSFRMQWPQYAELQVNGVPVRTTNRPGSQLLGVNGRDDGPPITACTREGTNRIVLSGCDARVFCLGVRIVRRRTLQQVLSLIPKELDGECFEEALARVCRCIGGGTAQDNGDSDSDLEVVAETVSVNLRCPMSGSRMKVSGRFKPCAHMGCFDLETFVELNQRARKWQCPICLKNYSLENLIIDPYFNRITTMMLDCEEDVTDIDVKPDGSWRVKNETERWNLVQWHSPNGSLSAPTVPEMKPGLETLKQVKQEGGSEGYTGLKLGIKKNHNGIWEVNKAEDTLSLSSENRSEKKPKTRSQKTMPTSSSAAGSYRDGEDPSVNDDGGGRFDFSMNNANELDSLGLSFESAYGATNRVPSAPRGNTDVIFLSDSDDETLNEVLPEAGINFSMPPPGVPDAYLEEPDVGNGDIDLFNGGNDEIEMHPWSLPMGTQAGPRLQLFGSEVEVSDTLAEVQTVKHTPSNCHGPMNGTPSKTDVSSIQVPVSDFRANANGSGGLFNKSLALGGDDDDTSLQIFLPSHTAREEAQGGANNQPILSSVVNTEDWISLRLGGGGSTNNVESTSTNGFNSRDKLSSKEGRMDTLADTALLLSMNDDRPDMTSTPKQRSGGPFSYPRQPRSVRPRLYLSIDSD